MNEGRTNMELLAFLIGMLFALVVVKIIGCDILENSDKNHITLLSILALSVVGVFIFWNGHLIIRSILLGSAVCSFATKASLE